MRQPPPPTFGQKFWASLEPLLIILLKDIVLFLIVLAALTIGFAGIAGMKALGIRPERAEIIETVHFYGYLVVLGIFLLDMIWKLLLEVLVRKS